MADTTIDIGSGCAFNGLTLQLSAPDTGGHTITYVMHSSYPAGATVTITWDNTGCSAGSNGGHFFVQLLDDQGTVMAPYFPGCATGLQIRTATLPRATQRLRFELGNSLVPGTFTLLNWSISTTPCGAPCPFGVRPQPLAAAVMKVTEDLLESWLLPTDDLWLLPIFLPFIGYDLVVSNLCSDIPPAQFPIDFSTLSASTGTVLKLLQIVAWPHLCECVPGTPTPTPPPPFNPVQPPGWPAQPIFSCDPADLCASIAAIRNQLFEIQTVLGSNLGLTTLLQRYQVPFAFIPGVAHGPLSLQGSFAVSRLVGLGIEVTASAPGHPDISDVPPYLWDRGWVSVTDNGAMLQERRVNRANFQWLPQGMGLVTSVGYSLTPGTQIRITELRPEP